MKVLVTGASGFIGSHLMPLLLSRGHEVVAASRSPVRHQGVEWRPAPQLGSKADWSNALQGAEAIVHLAGHAQTGGNNAKDEDLFRRINADGTLRLARQVAASSVRHFLFLSSVHAVAAHSDAVVTAATVPRPVSAYGRSKLAAEELLRAELESVACAWTILRPPAVYGPGNTSNFGELIKLATSDFPLPLASLRNRRSFIYVENLASAIVACLENPQRSGGVYFPGDDKDFSTPELIRAIAHTSAGHRASNGKHGERLDTRHRSPFANHGARMFPFPERVLKAIGRFPGLGALQKLTASLYVDTAPLRRDLGWTPPFTTEEGLRKTLAAATYSPS